MWCFHGLMSLLCCASNDPSAADLGPACPAAAQQKLQECEEVIDNDYFLAACKDEFVENARVFTFESYCRIHQVSLAGTVGARHKLLGIGCSMCSSKGS